MPDFTQWNVPSPFPNILFNPMAVDAAIAKTQSELGNLDINRQELALKQDAAARDLAFGDYLKKSLPTDGTTGTTSAGVGGTYAPGTPFTPKMLPPGASLDEDAMVRTIAGEAGTQPLIGQIAVAHVINNRAKGAGVSPRDVVFSPNQFEPWNGGAARARLEAMQPTDPAYQSILNDVVRPTMAGKAADPTGGATHFYAPVAQAAATDGRSPVPKWAIGQTPTVIGGHNFYKLGYGPGQARTASAPVATPQVAAASPPPFNPNAGPRVGLVPPPVTAAAPSVAPATAPGVNPNAKVQIPPATITGQADDPNTAAVKQASAALLNMPEPDAAAAYPAVVRELQARGFAMNAPPAYPGHAALQALVGGGEPAVAQTKTAMRLGGTGVAGPPGVVSAPAQPDAPPNRLAYGTGLPGVTIGLPQNGMAPPPAAAALPSIVTAAAPAQAQPQAATPTQPPPAPSRVIQREPLIQSGIFAGLTRTQASTIANTPGVKPATIMEQIATARHQNDVIRQGDATQAAVDAKTADDARHRGIEESRLADELAIKKAAEKRAADEAAAKAADPLQGKSEDERIERTLLQIAPKLRPGYTGPPPTDAEKDQYTLLWNKYREGPLQQVPDGKGGFFTARVPRDVPPDFPPPPGQKVSPGPQPIPGTEKMPDLAPPTVTGGMLANGEGQRKIMTALAGLQNHPDAVGAKGNAPDWLLQRADPEGIALRSAVSNVGGHEFHALSGAAVQQSEAARLKYIPSEKDTAFALKTKLQAMLEDNRATMLQSYRTYGPENGFRKVQAVEDAIIDSIPEAAMTMLKDKPETAKQFDKTYGKGAAKLVLQYGG